MLRDNEDAVIKLNVGGRVFATSRNTLTWIPDTFFTSLLSGRIPTLHDENGAIFIDRDPNLFCVILNYMRSKNVDLSNVDLPSLKHEAQFYGITPLVRRLALCIRLDHSHCGDLLFHGYFLPPTMNEIDGKESCARSTSHHRNLSEPIGFLAHCQSNQGGKAPGGAMQFQGSLMTRRVYSKSSVCTLCDSSESLTLNGAALSLTSLRKNSRTALGCEKIKTHRVSLSSDYAKLLSEDGGTLSCRNQDSTDLGPVRAIRGHQTWIAVAYNYRVVCYRLESNVGWCRSFTSPKTDSPIRLLVISSKIVQEQAEKLIAVAVEGNLIILWSTGKSLATKEVGRFSVPSHVDNLSFISSQLTAICKVGKIVVWHGRTKNWQVQDVARICCYDTAGSILLLGCANGSIYYIDMEKFPLRIKDNDLLVMELHRDPFGDCITAINVYLTPKSANSGNWLEIAYGTSSGTVRIIAQHPETASQTPQLFQTFTVHRSPVIRVALTSNHLISVCSEYNHVRSWTLTRFRGMINTQPGSTPLASFKVMTLDVDTSLDTDERVDVGPFGDKDSEQVFVQQVIPDTSSLYVRLASNGQRVCMIRAVDGVRITSYWVHEFEWPSGMGTRPRRFLLTGHANGSVQMWDLTTALEMMNSKKDDKLFQGPSCGELMQLINEYEITYHSTSAAYTPYGSTMCLPNNCYSETNDQ